MRKASLLGVIVAVLGQVFILVATPTELLMKQPVWALLTIGSGLLLPVVLLIVGAASETGSSGNEAHHFSGMIEQNIVEVNTVGEQDLHEDTTLRL
jgi:hypothetical protein